MIAVLAYHSRPLLAGTWAWNAASLGWSGVDLFFVLSGFLITSILLKSREQPRHYFRDFYARRALRIGPAYLVLLSVCCFGPAWLEGRHVAGLSRVESMVALLLWVQNLLHGSLAGSLAPTWSLAIEQQYYFSWAPAVRFLRRPWMLAAMLMLLLVASPLFRMHSGALNPMHTLLHLDGICAGSLLALGVGNLNWTRRRWLAVGAGAAIAGFAALVLLDGGTAFANSALALGFAGAVLATVAGTGARNPVAWLLRRGPLPFYGKISYGLYLMHLPIFIWLGFLHSYPPFRSPGNSRGPLLMAVTEFAIATAAAALLWYGLEQRILRLKRCFPGRAA